LCFEKGSDKIADDQVVSYISRNNFTSKKPSTAFLSARKKLTFFQQWNSI